MRERRRFLSRLWIAAGLCATLAPSPAHALFHQYGQGGAWPDGTVTACWRPSATSHPEFATWSRWTREAVQNTWGRAAQLRFTGWGACPSSAAGLVAIGFDNTISDQTSHIGFLPGSTSWVNFNQGATDGEVGFKQDAVHEFGHVLGFGDEMDRDGNPWIAPNGCWGTVQPGDTLGTPYDAASIMNDCRSGWALSAWDVVGVQNFYGRKKPGSLVGKENFALDLPGGSTTTGTQLQVYTHHGGSNQSWARGTLGLLQVYLGATVGTYRCADVPGGVSSGSGTILQSQACGTGPTQRFAFQDVAWVGMGGKCIAASGSGTSGATLELAACGTAATKRWTFEPNGTIRSATPGLCVEVPGGVGATGSLLKLASCSGAPAQTFSFTGLGEIRFGGFCVDSQWARPEDGHKLQLYPCKANGRDKRNQQFHLSGAVHGNGGQCLDIRGPTAYDGAKAQLYPICHGGPNQVWDYYHR